MKAALLALVALVLMTPAMASGGDRFTDDNGSVHEADIEWLAASGITKGCTPTQFCPDDLVTRGQMAAFMRRALVPAADTTLPDAFSDISDSIFRYDINAMADLGIVTGIGAKSDRFYPKWPLSRIEHVRQMYRAGWCGTQIAKIEVFEDVTLDDPVLAEDVPYVWACNKVGLLRGHNGNMFPFEGTTRAQMATFLRRAVG